jgi:hypothetical protein
VPAEVFIMCRLKTKNPVWRKIPAELKSVGERSAAIRRLEASSESPTTSARQPDAASFP